VSQSIHILIVDDEPHVLHVIKQFLQRKQFIVTTAQNGKKALDAYEAAKPDIIITDVQMPVMTGQDFCEEVLKRQTKKMPKIFMMTSRTDKQLRDWAGLFPVIEFLEKPLSLRRLSIQIDKVLSGEL